MAWPPNLPGCPGFFTQPPLAILGLRGGVGQAAIRWHYHPVASFLATQLAPLAYCCRFCPERQRTGVRFSPSCATTLTSQPPQPCCSFKKSAALWKSWIFCCFDKCSRLAVSSSFFSSKLDCWYQSCLGVVVPANPHPYILYDILFITQSFVCLSKNQNHYYTPHTTYIERSMMICIKILWLHITFIVFI